MRLRTSVRAVRRGRTVRLRLRVVAPRALAGRRVAVQRRVGRRVVTIARVRVARDGRVATAIRVPAAKAYRIRLVVAATATTEASTTRFLRVRLAAPRG